MSTTTTVTTTVMAGGIEVEVSVTPTALAMTLRARVLGGFSLANMYVSECGGSWAWQYGSVHGDGAVRHGILEDLLHAPRLALPGSLGGTRVEAVAGEALHIMRRLQADDAKRLMDHAQSAAALLREITFATDTCHEPGDKGDALVVEWDPEGGPDGPSPAVARLGKLFAWLKRDSITGQFTWSVDAGRDKQLAAGSSASAATAAADAGRAMMAHAREHGDIPRGKVLSVDTFSLRAGGWWTD